MSSDKSNWEPRHTVLRFSNLVFKEYIEQLYVSVLAGSEIQKTEWSYDTYESSDSVMNAFSQVSCFILSQLLICVTYVLRCDTLLELHILELR